MEHCKKTPLQDGPVMVSVYCLAYNHAKYIRHTLEGFVRQVTNFRYEVVVHDDASTDGTLAIIREYEQKYPQLIKVITQKENQYSKGVKIGKSFIFPILQGKYLAICEGDDYWCDDHKLQKQFDAMQAHPECSLCTHLVKCCNEDGSPNEAVLPAASYQLQKTGVIPESELVQCYWVRGGYPFHTSSYFYRREVLDVALDYPRDMGILRKALTLGSVFYLQEAMSVRRLWSVDNWNSRLVRSSPQKRFAMLMADIASDVRFDQFTNYKYHPYIKFLEWVLLLSALEFDEISAIERIRAQDVDSVPLKGLIPAKNYVQIVWRIKLIQRFPTMYLALKKAKSFAKRK